MATLTIVTPSENKVFLPKKPIMLAIQPSTVLSGQVQVAVDLMRLWANQPPTSVAVFFESSTKLESGIELLSYVLELPISKYRVRVVPGVESQGVAVPLAGWDWSAWRHFRVFAITTKVKLKSAKAGIKVKAKAKVSKKRAPAAKPKAKRTPKRKAR